MNRLRHLSHALLTAGLLVLLTACGPKSGKHAVSPATTEKPIVLTSFYPLEYMASRIAGDLAEVSCPVPSDADPVFWQPDDASIQAMQQADLVLLNGAGFEKWARTTVLPDSSVVHTAERITDPLLKYEDAILHTHGPGKEHKHEGTDGHTWMDPLLAIVQAQAVHDALAARLPGQAAELEKHFEALKTDLRSLDAAFRAIPAPPVLYAEHPAYSYPARRYGWTIEHIDVDHPPSGKTGLLLWESEPAKTFPGLTNLVFSPCEAAPETGDYFSVMRDNLSRLKQAL